MLVCLQMCSNETEKRWKEEEAMEAVMLLKEIDAAKKQKQDNDKRMQVVAIPSTAMMDGKAGPGPALPLVVSLPNFLPPPMSIPHSLSIGHVSQVR